MVGALEAVMGWGICVCGFYGLCEKRCFGE